MRAVFLYLVGCVVTVSVLSCLVPWDLRYALQGAWVGFLGGAVLELLYELEQVL